MRYRMLALGCFAAAGCVGTVDGWQETSGGSFGIVARPRLGDVITGSTATASITFAGVHEQPGYRIDVQVLDDPTVADSWVTIGTATTDLQPSSTDATMYEWSVTVAPAQLSPARWPQGGLLRVRAVGASGEVLAGLFHDSDTCLEQTEGWRDRADTCGGVFSSGIVVLSPADVASGADRPRFLDRRGTVDATETATYYQTIGAPATLADFRTHYAIDATASPSTYYNAADLGIGREMRCKAQADGGLACASSNYGEFGGGVREALDAAIEGTESGGGAFATVAMVYQPPADAPNSVRFMVYGKDGALANRAQLDTVGDNQSVPTNCLNCHGASATYDSSNHQVRGATFLPFDSKGFVFSDRAGYTAHDQAAGIAGLDQLVRAASPTTAIGEVIDGWYPRGATETDQADFVPAAWSATSLEKRVYQYVIADHCRGCHASRTDDLAFATAEIFHNSAASIASSICSTHDMPNAQVPLQRVWSGPARAYLAAYLDIAACTP